MTETTQTTTEIEAIADAIRAHEHFVVVSHENPDGDALGSLLAMALGLRSLGKDAVMYLAGDAALPGEYGFLDLDGLVRTPPSDLSKRVLVAVDCANARRIGEDPSIVENASVVLDIDHHHDNSRFGDVNLIVADASSTA